VAPCRSCVNRRFRGAHHLHLQGRKIRERGTSLSSWLQPRRRHSSITSNTVQFVSTCCSNVPCRTQQTLEVSNPKPLSCHYCHLSTRQSPLGFTCDWRWWIMMDDHYEGENSHFKGCADRWRDLGSTYMSLRQTTATYIVTERSSLAGVCITFAILLPSLISTWIIS
jgi:hypothetical protein